METARSEVATTAKSAFRLLHPNSLAFQLTSFAIGQNLKSKDSAQVRDLQAIHLFWNPKMIAPRPQHQNRNRVELQQRANGKKSSVTRSARTTVPKLQIGEKGALSAERVTVGLKTLLDKFLADSCRC